MRGCARRGGAMRRRSEPAATATVVRCDSPRSAEPGARGNVTGDGRITGWMSGGCEQPVVVEEALNALKDGTPRRVPRLARAWNCWKLSENPPHASRKNGVDRHSR